MQSNDKKTDLRLLSLLHALHDKEEFMLEVGRLIASAPIDDESWQQVCQMGNELAPGDSLFTARRTAGSNYPDTEEGTPARCSGLLEFDRRRQDRRGLSRRIKVDRRQQDRRAAALPWLGTERRTWQRRQYERRTNLVTP